MGTILLIGGIAVLAVIGVELGLRRRANKRLEEGTFDQGVPFIEGHHHGDTGADDVGAMDHIDPSDHPGV